MSSPQRLLIVDDEASVLAALKRAVRHRFGQALIVETQVDASAALEILRVREFELVISDLRMPAMDGLTFLRHAAELRPHMVRMVLTGTADFATAQQAINDAGVFRYLCKPWQDEDLASYVDAARLFALNSRHQRNAAQAWQDHREAPSSQELERRRLEALEPGLTHVEWGPNGEVLMPSVTSFGTLGTN
jgi:YesN/AraC family two-component response regulator